MRPQNIAARSSLPRLQIVVSTVPAERIQAGIQTQRLIAARMDYNRPDLVLSLCQAGARVQLQLLRAGLGLSLVFLFGLRQSESAAVFAYHRDYIWPLVALALPMCLVVCGYLTKPAAFIATLVWIWALYNGLQAGQALVQPSHPCGSVCNYLYCKCLGRRRQVLVGTRTASPISAASAA
jgi:hypothetical protein